MAVDGLDDILGILPQAMLRVGADCRIVWLEERFTEKTGLGAKVGGHLADLFEPGPFTSRLREGELPCERFSAKVVTCALREVRATWVPAREGGGGALVLEPAGAEDELAFSHTLQEIARAVSESVQVESVCAAAVVAMVRCADVSRAEVYLFDGARQLVRVATSDLAEGGVVADPGEALLSSRSLRHALATGQPEIGIFRPDRGGDGAIFAAVPLNAQRQTVGLLVLYKAKGASFSVRELDLWSAAAGQMAVAVENARLLREAQTALEIRDEFMSIASHELKTPLTPLKMTLYTMERKIAQNQPIDLASVLKSKRQVERLAGLVNDLLDASRLELGKLAVHRTPLDLAPLVAEVVDGFRSAFGRTIHLQVPAERLWVLGDRDRLEQVLVNLVENAHKYSPNDQPIDVRVHRSADGICVQVVDRGIGIPGGDQSQIFQRFYRARNASNRNLGGLGLGLFISHSIARLHGGDLLLESREGSGSTFTLSVPAMVASEVEMLPRRVLLVAPDLSEVAATLSALRGEGYEVVTAGDGSEALRNLASSPMDGVVLSPSLPEGEARLIVTGLETLALGQPVPVIQAKDRAALNEAVRQRIRRPNVDPIVLRLSPVAGGPSVRPSGR